MGKSKCCKNCCCHSEEKAETLPTYIRVGPQPTGPIAEELSLGVPFASWADVPKEVLDGLVAFADTTLLNRREEVLAACQSLDPDEALRMIKNSVEVPPLHAGVKGWIWFPYEGGLLMKDIAYCRYEHRVTLDSVLTDLSKGVQ